MRNFDNLQYGNESVVRQSLTTLADKSTSVEEYRTAFQVLGEQLGKVLTQQLGDVPAKEMMIVCAAEDADWLAYGVEKGIGKGKLPLSVYWTSRSTIYQSGDGEKIEISPIVKAYEEPISKCSLMIVVKSIISSSCVVKTQLNRLIDRVHPERIAILSPVMYKDGVPNLMKEFPDDVNRKFHFISFAVDNERVGDEVVPGIGGMVYPRLGLGDMNEKNQYLPQMVRLRMA